MIKWRQWLQGANASIYSCNFLAAWSGRMWAFSMGLFLISVSPGSLQLSAIYGLSMGAAVLVFGAIIGDWVDRTDRLKAATASMICQNALITTCACVVLTLLMLLTFLGEVTDWFRHLLYAIIISLSVCSRLMKEARIIVVERDWIVEMCARDEHKLAVMTSSFRRIDLLTKILAPIVTGQVMTFAGLKAGCGFIAVWSLISLGAEYYLIRRVYSIVPALKTTKGHTGYPVVAGHEEQVQTDESSFPEKVKFIAASETCQTDATNTSTNADRKLCKGPCCLRQILSSFLIMYRGFKTYFHCKTKWPGMALACLYLTVLGFDEITVGYATIQGLSGSILGIMMGVGACFGVLATFTYPFIVRKFGLSVTGVLALGMQVSCLTLCVVSVWLPGSPFDLFFSDRLQGIKTHPGNCSIYQQNSTQYTNDTNDQLSQEINTFCVDEVPQPRQDPGLSVWVMIAGIVLARFGLWTADLATIQLFLENVSPRQRGIINGFQTSLNQLMDFLKYALVVVLPHPQQFGFLVFISYAFICTGWMFMGVNAVKTAKRRKVKSESNNGEEIVHKNKIIIL